MRVVDFAEASKWFAIRNGDINKIRNPEATSKCGLVSALKGSILLRYCF
jgi:hypothetical protein